MSFEARIREFCQAQGWEPEELGPQRALIRFNMPSGREQMLYIIEYETTLEFSVPSFLRFEAATPQAVPGVLMLQLLRRNAQRAVGFWCVEEAEAMLFFSVMHNLAAEQLDGATFKLVAEALVHECDAVEQLINEAMDPSWDVIASTLYERLTIALQRDELTLDAVADVLHSSVVAFQTQDAWSNPALQQPLEGLLEGLNQFVTAALQSSSDAYAADTLLQLTALLRTERVALEEVLGALRDALVVGSGEDGDPALN